MNRPRIAVTGAAGFLGSRIVELLVGSGHEVIAISRRPIHHLPEVRLVVSEVGDRRSMRQAFEGCQGVIHAAGLAHRRASVAELDEHNVQGTSSVVQSAGEAGVAHTLVVSSVSVYGADSAELIDEQTPCTPDSAYGRSKRAAEIASMEAAKSQGAPLTILRMATIYGEGDPGNLARLIRAIDRKRFRWIGASENLKTVIHRDDAAAACVAAVKKSHGYHGNPFFNVAADVASVRSLVQLIAYGLGRRIPSWQIPPALVRGLAAIADLARDGEPYQTAVRTWLRNDAYDSRRFRETFLALPQVPLEAGLAREVAWYRAQERSAG